MKAPWGKQGCTPTCLYVQRWIDVDRSVTWVECLGWSDCCFHRLKRKKEKEIGFMSIWMGKEVFFKCLGLWSSVLADVLTDFKWNITASYMLMHRRLVSSARYGSVDEENKAGPRLWNVWSLGDSSSLENNQLKSSVQTFLLITLASTNPTLQSHQPLRFLDTKVPSSLVVAFSPRPLWPLNDNLEWFCLWVWRRVKKFLWALTESKEA